MSYKDFNPSELWKEPVEIRLFHAKSEASSPEVLRVLSKDSFWFVRDFVASNPSTPVDSLQELLMDPDFRIHGDAERTLGKLGYVVAHDNKEVSLSSSKDYVSIEEARKVFEPSSGVDSVKEVDDTKWQRHWNNAREATTKTQLLNLLHNHERIFQGKPSGSGFLFAPDHSEDRTQIICFLRERLKNEFSYIEKPPLEEIVQNAELTCASQSNLSKYNNEKTLYSGR